VPSYCPLRTKIMDVKPRNLPEQKPIGYWWPGEPMSPPESIEEERLLSEYDCGYFDLGAETPNSSNFMQNPAPFHLPTRRHFFRRASPVSANRLSKYAVDRDCGICFEYAVLPCRTLCCGKIFCTEHLADWLHGPEAEGRCPNCENACSLAGGTLSLASPSELSSSKARRYSLAQTQAIHSPSTPVQLHLNDTLTNPRDESHPQMALTTTKSTSSSSTSSHSSTVDYSETTISAEELKMIDEQHHIHPFQNEEHLTNSFRLPWGVASRLISILVFLMFLYKLRS